MAAPWHGFSAHDGYLLSPCQLDQISQIPGKIRGLHVIGIAAEGCIAPSGIRRLWTRVTKTAKPRHMDIAYMDKLQRCRQSFTVELGVMPGTRDSTHIHQTSHRMSREQADKLFDGSRGMPHGQHQRLSRLVNFI